MLFSLVHAFLIFFCVVVIVRLMLPAQYALLNPYAATLDNLLTRLLTVLRPALPMPPKPLCVVLLALALCADAVMLSRMHVNAMAVNLFVAYALPAATFKNWLLIAVLGLFRHFIMLLAGMLVLQVWHRSRLLPGYSGDLLRLALFPVGRCSLALQWGILFVAAAFLAFLMNWHAESVTYPFENLEALTGMMGDLSKKMALSNLVPGLRFVAVTGLIVLEVFSELHELTVTLILFAILCALTRNQSLSYFIKDIFRLLKGPLPEFRMGFLYLTPILILLVCSAAGGVLQALFMMLIEVIATVGGLHVV